MIDFSAVKKQHVEKAIQEYRDLGKSKFMALVKARTGGKTWFVTVPGAKEPAGLKLIAARAYNISRPRSKPARPKDFNTARARLALGGRLGYKLIGPGSREEDNINRDIKRFDLKDLKKAFEESRRLARVRRGTAKFRNALLAAYSRCAITGETTKDTLEAAHILPYKGPTSNHVQNGLLLRADVHALFDLNLIKIEPDDYTIRVNQKLRRTAYFKKYDGKRLKLPPNTNEHPSPMALSERQRTFT